MMTIFDVVVLAP